MASRIRRHGDNTRFAFRSRARLAQKAHAARAAFSSAYQRKWRLLRNSWMESYARKIYLSRGETPCLRRDSARERNGDAFGKGEKGVREIFFFQTIFNIRENKYALRNETWEKRRGEDLTKCIPSADCDCPTCQIRVYDYSWIRGKLSIREASQSVNMTPF